MRAMLPANSTGITASVRRRDHSGRCPTDTRSAVLPTLLSPAACRPGGLRLPLHGLPARGAAARRSGGPPALTGWPAHPHPCIRWLALQQVQYANARARGRRHHTAGRETMSTRYIARWYAWLCAPFYAAPRPRSAIGPVDHTLNANKMTNTPAPPDDHRDRCSNSSRARKGI